MLVEHIKTRIRDLSNNQPDSEIKRQIFEKLRKRMAELANKQNEAAGFCPELNPDVIVISDDQSFLFEPQNQRALELLTLRCGLLLDGLKLPDRIRVHPLRSPTIIDELRIAGLNVAC